MKARKIKAKRYWKTSSGTFLHPDKKSAQYFSGFNAAEVAPVVVLPADAASVERMVVQITVEWMKGGHHSVYDLARSALAAIGIKGGAK